MKLTEDTSQRDESLVVSSHVENWTAERRISAPQTPLQAPVNIGRVFVVGCPRSGTTLVQSLLAAHSKVMAFTESHLFDKGFRSLGRRAILRLSPLREYAAKFVEENEHLPKDAQARISATEPAEKPAQVAQQIINLLDEAARDGGAAFWVEKTPDHVYRIPLIRSVASNARFIHVIRKAEGVLPSLYIASRQWGRQKTWFSCAVHWLTAVWLSALHARGKNHFVIVYEDLLEQPDEIARAMFEWLGLEWHENILTQRPQAAAKCIAANETWKAATLQESPPSNVAVHVPFFARAITWLNPYALLRRRAWRG